MSAPPPSVPPPPRPSAPAAAGFLPVAPLALSDDYLYKCANPPPSYRAAIGAPDATPPPLPARPRPPQPQQHPRLPIIIAPFGGSFCHQQIWPADIAGRPLEAPPAYSRNVPSTSNSRNGRGGESTATTTNTLNRACICCARVDKQRLCLFVACFTMAVTVLLVFVLLDKLIWTGG